MRFLQNVAQKTLELRGLLASLRSYYRGSRGRDQREFYDLESSLPYFDHVSRILCRHKRQLILSFLAEFLARRPFPAILDVGCGIGHFARILARRGFQVTGIDISPSKIEKAEASSRREGQPEGMLAYRAADVRHLGEDRELEHWLHGRAGSGVQGRFDVVLAADVLEHVPQDPRETLFVLRPWVSPGGKLIASVPSRLCLRDPGHIWRHLPDDWGRIFEGSGFRIWARRTSRICWYGIPTPLPLAEVFDLRPEP